MLIFFCVFLFPRPLSSASFLGALREGRCCSESGPCRFEVSPTLFPSLPACAPSQFLSPFSVRVQHKISNGERFQGSFFDSQRFFFPFSPSLLLSPVGERARLPAVKQRKRITSNSMFCFDLLLLLFLFGPHQASRHQQRLFTTSSTTVDHCNDFSLHPHLGRPRAALRALPRARPRSPRAAAGRRQPSSASVAAIGTWPQANAASLRTESPAEAAGGGDGRLLPPPVRAPISLRTRGWREWSGKAAGSARSFPPSSSLFSPLAATAAAAAAAADALPVGFRGSGSAETYEEGIPFLSLSRCLWGRRDGAGSTRRGGGCCRGRGRQKEGRAAAREKRLSPRSPHHRRGGHQSSSSAASTLSATAFPSCIPSESCCLNAARGRAEGRSFQQQEGTAAPHTLPLHLFHSQKF